MRKKILFIINPISGIGKQKIIEKLISENLDKSKFSVKIEYTKYRFHAFEISEKYKNLLDIIVIVGGDGSVNEVSQSLIFSKTIMGIIPAGSGNGFARHLKIPLNLKKAILLFNNFSLKKVDSVKINDKIFVNVAGIGFDARIAHQFEKLGKRGFYNYVKLTIKEFFYSKNKKFRFKIGKKIFEKNAFMLSFANSSQFGNNVFIAPYAKIDDGFLDICFLKKFPFWEIPKISYMFFSKKIFHSKYWGSFKEKKITFLNDKKIEIHIDGEAQNISKNIELEVQKHSLLVAVP
ncbi:MAG: hypothetical protein B6I24_04715 [Bacteroidetes bacterium 4572_128]|nr:MAG: hypothetical protein B6I24_04715 [Bacteroidetes bacterium 4572_128]